ncbi:MAG: hypothetical protein AAGI66_07700 [Cyanobacteria bacterium P01_H01_bin.74]
MAPFQIPVVSSLFPVRKQRSTFQVAGNPHKIYVNPPPQFHKGQPQQASKNDPQLGIVTHQPQQHDENGHVHGPDCAHHHHHNHSISGNHQAAPKNDHQLNVVSQPSQLPENGGHVHGPHCAHHHHGPHLRQPQTRRNSTLTSALTQTVVATLNPRSLVKDAVISGLFTLAMFPILHIFSPTIIPIYMGLSMMCRAGSTFIDSLWGPSNGNQTDKATV